MNHKYKTVKLNTAQSRLLGEAWRRMGLGYKKKTISDNFLGLGFPSEYRPVVEAGLMTPSFRPEMPRVMGWYKLTDVGQRIVKQMIRKHGIPDFMDSPSITPYRIKVKIPA